MNQKKDLVCLLTGISAVLIGYFAWGLLTVFHKSGSFGIAGVLFSVLTMLLFAVFSYTVAIQQSEKLNRQLVMICGLGSLLSLLLVLRGGAALILQGEYAKLGMNLLWTADFTGCWLFLRNHAKSFSDNAGKSRSTWRDWKEQIRAIWKNQKFFYMMFAVTVLLLIEPDAIQFKWDGLLYYLACQDGVMDSISSLAPYGHIAQTYCMLNCVGSLIVGNMAVAMVVINILLFLCSIGAFYGMIKSMLPGKRDFEYALVTAFYAWSPFTLGMVYYHSLDFYCQCFFVIMLYFLYRKQWIYFFVCSVLFCFTKEPAILIYGAICVGIVILDFTDQKGKPFIARLVKLLCTKRYYFMVLPGVLWLTTYKILGPWSGGVGEFKIDGVYVLEKLKTLYVFQFNWLFTLFCLIGMVICLIRKEKSVWRHLIPVLCGQIAFTGFSGAFKTVNHPRYNGASQPMLYIIMILLTAGFLDYLYGRMVAAGMAALMLISSFYTIDPITRLFFPNYDIGNAVMVTADPQPLGDGMVYNRQMLWLEHALEEALEESLAVSDTVLFPVLGGNTYYFDGMAKTTAVDSDYYLQQEYWDPAKRRRLPTLEDRAQAFTVCQLAEDPDWDTIAEKFDGRKNYCYLPCAGEQRAEEIRRRFRVLEEKEYIYRGWKVNRICFE